MADTTNPRAGGANPGGRRDGLTGDAAREADLNVEIYGLKQTLSANKPGSAKYKAALEKIKKAQDELDSIKARAGKKKSQSDSAAAADERQKLVDEVTRANDYGTPAEQAAAKKKLDDFDQKTPNAGAELRYGPNGESLVPGTDAYAKGSTVKPVVSSSGVVTKGGASTGGTKSGSSTGGTGTGSGTGAGSGSDATKTAWISYLQTTFKTLPKDQKAQIDQLLTQAKNQTWDEKTFIEALKGTTWWQTTLPTLRQFFLDTHDPRNAATFAQTLQNQIDNVSAKLETLGVRAQQIDPATGKFYDNSTTIKGIAMDSLKNGWNDNQLMQHLGDNAQLLFTGGGTIGSSIDNIKRQALLYGVNIDDNYLKTIQYSLLDPTDARDTQYYLNEMKNQAIDLYKPFADSIKSGRSLYEVTNNYRQQMATLLEVDPSNISWNDLMSKVVDGTTGNARTFADFNKQLKQDPLWQYTKNAKETYSNMALDLMKQFGFVG